ncbi:hypothetical protein DFH07DRAFT_967629 [Mycena maculata]|uniref:Zn(2)-C6 fungal-type domain-containing protein n=1 Tax=Mycena maculata TaxID=230809 RepID=A0AAD7MV95_9AGAR|nr:hypothetical protein DFH07DRAFT_967629 [Mycena maculata]
MSHPRCGQDLLYSSAAPQPIDLGLPPYIDTPADVKWPTNPPTITVTDAEQAPFELDQSDQKALYFLDHPTVAALIQIGRKRSRAQNLVQNHPQYLRELLQLSQPAFATFVLARKLNLVPPSDILNRVLVTILAIANQVIAATDANPCAGLLEHSLHACRIPVSFAMPRHRDLILPPLVPNAHASPTPRSRTPPKSGSQVTGRTPTPQYGPATVQAPTSPPPLCATDTHPSSPPIPCTLSPHPSPPQSPQHLTRHSVEPISSALDRPESLSDASSLSSLPSPPPVSQVDPETPDPHPSNPFPSARPLGLIRVASPAPTQSRRPSSTKPPQRPAALGTRRSNRLQPDPPAPPHPAPAVQLSRSRPAKPKPKPKTQPPRDPHLFQRETRAPDQGNNPSPIRKSCPVPVFVPHSHPQQPEVRCMACIILNESCDLQYQGPCDRCNEEKCPCIRSDPTPHSPITWRHETLAHDLYSDIHASMGYFLQFCPLLTATYPTANTLSDCLQHQLALYGRKGLSAAHGIPAHLAEEYEQLLLDFTAEWQRIREEQFPDMPFPAPTHPSVPDEKALEQALFPLRN